jgi:hypothetical protein
LANDEITIIKITAIVQAAYTLVTIFLVIITFATLIETREQKNQDVRPYLVASNFTIYENEKDLDFFVRNDGIGLALNIVVKVMRTGEFKPIHEEKIQRVSVFNNNVSALNTISSVLDEIKNKGEVNCSYNSHQDNDEVYIETHLPKEFGTKIEFTIHLSYENIYGKKYNTVFEVEFSDKDYELISTTEKYIEV